MQARVDAAEERAAAAEAQAKVEVQQAKAKAKQDVVNIRAELVAAAKEAIVAAKGNDSFNYDQDAKTVLKKLKAKDPNEFFELIKAQPEYVKLAKQLEIAHQAADKQHAKHEETIFNLKIKRQVEDQDSDGSMSEYVDALMELRTELFDAASDMRTNSGLTNQKKTLVSQKLGDKQ